MTYHQTTKSRSTMQKWINRFIVQKINFCVEIQEISVQQHPGSGPYIRYTIESNSTFTISEFEKITEV